MDAVHQRPERSELRHKHDLLPDEARAAELDDAVAQELVQHHNFLGKLLEHVLINADFLNLDVNDVLAEQTTEDNAKAPLIGLLLE